MTHNLEREHWTSRLVSALRHSLCSSSGAAACKCVSNSNREPRVWTKVDKTQFELQLHNTEVPSQVLGKQPIWKGNLKSARVTDIFLPVKWKDSSSHLCHLCSFSLLSPDSPGVKYRQWRPSLHLHPADAGSIYRIQGENACKGEQAPGIWGTLEWMEWGVHLEDWQWYLHAAASVRFWWTANGWNGSSV